MRKTARFFKVLSVTMSLLCIVIFSLIFSVSGKVTSSYRVFSGENLKVDTVVPLKATYCGENLKNVSSTFSVGSKYDVDLKIFGVIPVGKTNVELVDEMYVLPLGTPFGMKIYTKGVLVVDLTDVDSSSGFVNPASAAGLKVGDLIISINSTPVYSNSDVSKIIEESGGKPLTVVFTREEKEMSIKVTPVKSQSTGVYKAGIWVRDSSAGIGTLTFYSPNGNVICGLGHGVCDSDTGKLLTLSSGELLTARIISYETAETGTPGELKGSITLEKYADMVLNCECGVYGITDEDFDTSRLIPVALKQDVSNGEAYIITTIDDDTPVIYTCNVKKVKNLSNENQNLIVEITDEELLNRTGGILQGMSGSPIIQDGKLIGAVTHVLIDDPTTGYGVYAETMLETAKTVGEQQLKSAS